MKNKTTLLTLFTTFFLCMTPRTGSAQPIEGWATSRVQENLDRGLLVQMLDDNAGVYINWRQLKEDGPTPSYNVYVDRAGDPVSYELLNTTAPITQTTDVVDPAGELGDYYYVENIDTGSESDAFSAHDAPYFSIDVGGSFEKVGVGDLNGDGVMDFVIRTPAGTLDPAEWKEAHSNRELKLKAFDGYTGAHLWTYEYGPNIEPGTWYSPYIVYDFDGDGEAEVALKTGATVAEDGAAFQNYREDINGDTDNGKVTTGPEYLTIIESDGSIDIENAREAWPNRDGHVKYNWYSRNQIAVAYLDGKTPFIIAERGTYGILKVRAFTYRNGALHTDPSWYWDSTHEYSDLDLDDADDEPNRSWFKQGAHSIRVGNVDSDDREEIILGACVLDDDLTGLWAKPSRYDQIDHTYLGELDPTNPGLELFMGAEHYSREERGSQTMVNPATGADLWTSDPGPHHIHGVGIASDLDPDHDGVELWGRDKEPDSSSNAYNYFNAQGEPIEYESLLFNKSYDYHAVYWDADPQRELVTGSAVFDRKAEAPLNTVEWDMADGGTTNSYVFWRYKTVWSADWDTSPGSNRVDFREGFEDTNNPPAFIEIVPASGSDEWTMTWKGDPIYVTPQSHYFVRVKFKSISYGENFRMEILANGVNIMPGAPSISVDDTGGGDLTYLAVFTAPAGVTEIKPVLKGDGPSNYTYQISSINILEDNTPNRIRLELAGTDRFWGDILGDWREEIITSYGNELRVYSTRVPAVDRRVTYLQDPIYRADVAALAMGYAQVPTASTLPAFDSDSGQGGGETVSLGAVNRGIAALDNATGTGYILWSETNLHTRFNPHQYNSDHMIAVKWTGSEWVYYTNEGYVTFTPQASDVLIAEVDFSNDTITSLQGVSGTYQGIELGYASGDLTFAANVWNGGSNAGEFTISGTLFTKNGGGGGGGETVSLGAVNRGIAAQDNATGTGFIMWSATNVHTRFNPNQYNSDHMIAVKWTGSEWVCDNNNGYVSFTPQASDVLIAELDFSNDTISSLEGVSVTYQGIELGYASGDLTFAANVWDGQSNNGEFTVSGTAFTKNGGGGGETVSLGAVNRGIAAKDNATGTGYILWSETNLHTRFNPFQDNSDHVIAVKWTGSEWVYDNNNGYVSFTPQASDVLIAEVDFSNDTISSLEGVSGTYQGIELGYASGDLTFAANVWNGQSNNGEFTVSGTAFTKNGGGTGGTEILPAAYWDFDDGSGNIAMDLSSNALDLSLLGGYSWTSGQVGGALYLDGQSNSYGSVPDPDVLEDTDKLSFSFWVRPENNDGNARFIVSKRDAQNVNCAFSLFFYTGNRLYVDLDHNNNGNRHSTGTQFQNNSWYHVAVVYDGTLPQNERGRVYINGELDANSPFAVSGSSIPDYPSDLTLGTANSGYHSWFKGRIDDLLIFREALQASEVEDLFEY